MKSLRIFCPLNPTGVGVHGQHLCAELIPIAKENNVQLQIVPTGIVTYSTSPLEQATISSHLIKQGTIADADVDVILDVPSKCLKLRHDYDKVLNGKTVFYTVFELAYPGFRELKPYSPYLDLCHQAEEVWVPSRWLKEVLDVGAGGYQGRIKVVPEGASDVCLPMVVRPSVFTIGTIGKFERRKGHLVLLDSILKVGDIRFKPFWHNYWDAVGSTSALMKRGFENGHKSGGFINGSVLVEPQKQVRFQRDLIPNIQDIDVGVFPHFAEGWGLGALEMIVAGIPVICSNHTGSKDYMNRYLQLAQHLPIPPLTFRQYTEVEAEDGVFFKKGMGTWFEVSGDELTDVLQQWKDFVKDEVKWKEVRQEFKLIGKKMYQEFSWQKSAQAFFRSAGE